MNGAALHPIPHEPGKGRAIALALVVHLALLTFLWVGVRWQSEAPVAAEAEIWDIQTREAAPKPVAPPEPVAETKPVVKETPPPPAPRAVQQEAVAKPDIALEREKKRKEAAQKKADDAKRVKEETLAREAEDRRIKQEKAKAAKNNKRAQELADQKARAALRADEMRRIAGSTGSGGSGTAARSTGNNRSDVAYAQKVSAKIRSNTAFNVPQSLNGNPAVEYSVELLPDGSLRTAPRKLKSSGVSGFDEAVLRAIEKTAPYPADRTGTVPPSFIVSHKPKG